MKRSILKSASTLAIVLVSGAVSSVPAQENVMSIPDQRVIPGQTDVWFPVMAKHVDDMQGYQVRAVFDSEHVTLRECTHRFSSVTALEPEIFECNVRDTSVESGVLFDFVPPFTNKVLPPADDNLLLHLVFDIGETEPPGKTEIRLLNDDTSVVQNIFTIDGRSLIPELVSSCVEIVDDATPADFFIRGDADNNGEVQISDAVVVLEYLFLGGAAPRCQDAADATDDGVIQVTSAISILEYLFLGGSRPKVPFPTAGLDPSSDSLEPCGG